MGLLAVLRSKATKGTIGVMITASHNPEQDNGVKLTEPMGEMLVPEWEAYATSLANARDEDVKEVLREIITGDGIDMDVTANVFLAKDTRPSSYTLSQSLQDGIQTLHGQYTNFGLLTTPQLHYMVRCHNTKGLYGQPTEQGYYTKLSQAFLKLRQLVSASGDRGYSPVIIVDGANGVGALKIQQLLSFLKGTLDISVCNDGTTGKLNEKCGADFVKLLQKCPNGVEAVPDVKCVSFDGDADRIVYFYVDKEKKFYLLDGDKLATLFAGYIQNLLTLSGLTLNVGLVQTAYANGSSTQYAVQEIKVPVACVKTGVKHLHHKAAEFDIGVYFEANGHGTVLYSKRAEEAILSASQNNSLSESQRHAAECLQCLVNLTNQTVGDALADMLLVEAILYAKGWNVQQWNSSYTDLPNRQLKVKVKDRTVIRTTDAERQVTAPEGLQDAINKTVSNYRQARSFVRPSGTEDIVRVYAEAETQASADELAKQIALQVFQLAGGIGDPPN
ncbi:putative phosphoacetylglucosamine mutase [Apostichopus japonicus]|uniref:Phosphoacetylglucosamine mutase n=1 Tax=Stichopus japonicus TaxID=307972 RepID=A0A2G8LE72_STIJA|nr:putative phosphoacetylglucosamine mutase [Apostichopus japonicus]